MSLDLDDLRVYCQYLDDHQGRADVEAIVGAPTLRPEALHGPLVIRWRLLAAVTALIVAGVGLGFVLDRDWAPADALDTLAGLTPGGPDTRVVVSPLVEVQANLLEQSELELFSVRVAPGDNNYWRLMSLDEFDGELWRSSSSFEPADGAVPSDLDTSVPTNLVRQTITTTGQLANIFLPLAFELSEVISSEGIDSDTDLPIEIHLEYEAESATLVVTREDYAESLNGFTYVIESAVPVVDVPRLRSSTTSSLDSDFLDHYTNLPSDFPESIKLEAERITAGAASDYDLALGLQDHFQAGFTYNINVALEHDAADMEAFLFEYREGHSEQFASTFAAMARSIGLPARVAVGFTWGDWSASRNAYVVRGEHAHAWPEVYFAGTGWIRFEPTPQRGGPSESDLRITGLEPSQIDTVPTNPEPRETRAELDALLDDLDRTDVDHEDFVLAVESWRRQGIADYQFTLENHCECDDETRGPFLIIVSGGAFAEAFRDGEPVQSAPTILDLFALIAQGLADGVRVEAEYDWVVGHPMDAVIDIAAVAVDGGRSFSVSDFHRHDNDSPQAVQITEATTAWEAAGLTDYSYTFQRECFCPLAGPYEIIVTNGVSEGLPAGVMGSIDELLEQADRAVDFAASADFTYDPDYGFPASADIDWVSNARDDEIQWTITDFTTR